MRLGESGECVTISKNSVCFDGTPLITYLLCTYSDCTAMGQNGAKYSCQYGMILCRET
jgi:hypothetical protein